MKTAKITIIGMFVALLLIGCSDREEDTELQIAAAASLTDAMDEIKEIYEEEHEVTLEFNFAGSGKLAQQIEQGAPVDVFISANENWMEKLEEKQLVDDETIETIAGNKLVLIAAKDTTLPYDSFEDIVTEDVDQIAIGVPESVPAGEYAQTVLKQMGNWETLEDKFVFAKDVRQVLTYVESGNADIGFVYLSDAMISDDVTILAESDPSEHEAIVYPGAITTDSDLKEEAQSFLTFLRSEKAQNILEKYGFVSE